MPTAANAYSNFYFFGDSLTDTGAFGGLGGLPANARWTLAYGTGWAEALGQRYGLSVTPNNALNNHIANTSGNNFAQGDARAQPASPPNTNPDTPAKRRHPTRSRSPTCRAKSAPILARKAKRQIPTPFTRYG